MRRPSAVTTNAWSVRPLLPGSTATPAAFHLATDSCTLGTRETAWLNTPPPVPPRPRVVPSLAGAAVGFPLGARLVRVGEGEAAVFAPAAARPAARRRRAGAL